MINLKSIMLIISIACVSMLSQILLISAQGGISVSERIFSVAWSPNGEEIALGGGYVPDGEHTTVSLIQIRNANSGILVETLDGNSQAILTVAWSPDGAMLASGSTDGFIMMWHREPTGFQLLYTIQVTRLENENLPVTSLTWSPDGTKIASSHTLGVVKVWDVLTGNEIYSFQKLSLNEITTASWDSSGYVIAFSATGGDVTLWNPFTDQVEGTYHNDALITCLEWQPNSNAIAFGDYRGTVKIWDSSINQTTQMFPNQSNRISAISWHPNGVRLASTTSDGQVIVWNTETGVILETKYQEALLLDVAYSPDGTRLAYTGDSSELNGEVTVDPVINQLPIADSGSDQFLTDSGGNGSELVTLDGSASSDPDGTIVSYSWSENGVEIATGINPQVNFTVGVHTVTLIVTDDDGATDTDEVVITVNPGAVGATITITVPPTDGTILTTQDDTRFQAVAYDPAVGTNDGDGIQQIEFEVYNPSGTLIYSLAETQAATRALLPLRPKHSHLLTTAAALPTTPSSIVIKTGT